MNTADERAIVIHVETGVRCGTFPDANAAQKWLDQLGVTAEYKLRCYRIVNYQEYWNRKSYAEFWDSKR